MSSYYPGSIDYYADEEMRSAPTSHRNQNFVSPPIADIVIIEPTSFGEMSEAIQALKRQQMIVLNLTHMDYEEAQRSVDFLAGGTLMFNGSIEKIDHKIFIFAPHSTEILFSANQDQQNDAVKSGQPGSASPRNYIYSGQDLQQQHLIRQVS